VSAAEAVTELGVQIQELEAAMCEPLAAEEMMALLERYGNIQSEFEHRGKRILFIGFNAGSTVCCRSVPRVVDRLPEVLKRDAIPRVGGRRPGRPPRPKR
jgi:hypothetical protein